MTTNTDDAALERAFEACLAGRPVPDEAAGLAAFADAIHATATRPGRPSAALAELLTTGLLTDLSTPPARVARSAGRPGAARDRRRRLRMFLPALFAKFVAAGAVAKAATGAGVVVVGLSTAGSLGVLPGSAQHTFATVVEAVTPFEAPDPQQTEEPAAPPASPADTAVPTDTSDDDTATDAPTRTHPSDFGRSVSEQAHQSGGVDGRSISSQAHQRNADRKAQRSAGSTPTPATQTAGPGDDAGHEVGDDDATVNGGRSGSADDNGADRYGSGHGGGNR